MRIRSRVKYWRLPLWLLPGWLIVAIVPLYSASPVTFYTGLSAFQAAVTNPSSFGFNNVQQISYDSSAGLTINNFNFVGQIAKSGGPGYWLSVNGPNAYFNDYSRISPNSSLQAPAATSPYYSFSDGKLIVTMPTGGVTAFGLQLWDIRTGDTSGAGTDTVNLTVDGVTGTTVTPPYSGEGFIGFTSTVPITSVTLTGTAAEEFPEIGQVYTGTALATGTQNAPTISSVLNLFDYSATNLCPGVLVAIYGSNFGTSDSAVSITVGGKPGYIVPKTAVNNQVNAEIPFEVSAGPTTVIITVNGVPSAPFPITLAATAPSFPTVNSTGSGSGTFASSTGAVLTSAAPAKPGDLVSAYVTGLGATNPPTATSATPQAGNVPAATPTITMGGQPAAVRLAVTTQYPGTYQINFIVPAGVQGNAPIVLTAGGISSSSEDPKNPVTIPIFGISYISNNASFAGPGTSTPGTIVSVFGNGFGTTSQTAGFPATTFQGVSVTFNGTAAPLFHLTNTPANATTAPLSIGASQIDLLVPYELPYTGTVQVAVQAGSQTSPNYALTMAAATPGMYYIQDPSTTTRTNILAQFNNTAWLNMPAFMATALQDLPGSTFPGLCQASFSALSQCGQPAKPGDILVLYGTGLGLATPNGNPSGTPLATGNVAPADGSVLYETVTTPTIMVGGIPAKVLFSGITPGLTGEYQIDFTVPAGITGDDVPVVFSMGSSPTDTRTMSIQPAPST